MFFRLSGGEEEANYSCIFCEVEHLVGMGSIFTVLYIQYLHTHTQI